MMKLIRNQAANAITCLNLVCGTLAIVASFKCYEPLLGSGWEGYKWAYLLMGLAAIADFLDGAVARLLHASSGIGKELDSLADEVSFGLAPAMVLGNMMYQGHSAGAWSLIAVLLPVAGALRLARFNVDTRQSTTFTGLPIPANALFWIGATAWYAQHAVPTMVVALAVVTLAWLMICQLRMFSLKMHNISSLATNWAQYLLIVATIVLVAWLHLPGLAVMIVLYVLLSIIKHEQ